MKLYLNIFIAFFGSGMLGFGGGPSSIPLIHKEVVSTFKWMTDDEFSNVVALGNTLPGPINTKMAGYISYRIGGMIGLLVALFAGVLPTVLLMLALLTFSIQFKDNPNVQGMTNAVVPIVGVMMGVLTWGFLKNEKNGLGWKNGSILLIGCSICIVVLQIHPGMIIGLLLVGALALPEKKRKSERL